MENKMYMLYFHEDFEPFEIDNNIIGVYSSKELAENAMEKCLEQGEIDKSNEFRKYFIREMQVNKKIPIRKYMAFSFNYIPKENAMIPAKIGVIEYTENPILKYVGNEEDGAKLTFTIPRDFYDKEIANSDVNAVMDRLEFLAREYLEKVKKNLNK
jgi:hypothetical protein